MAFHSLLCVADVPLSPRSGKIVLTGAKSREQIDEAFRVIYPIVTDFRKQ
eukprot:m.124136 g.124136  ORF g.124136 m.124136 type:complete len:50 (-) comp9666_c1_seq2:327-476(-)